MTEHISNSPPDGPINPGLFRLEDLYLIQPVEVKKEHARHLMSIVRIDQNLMRYVDLTREMNDWGIEREDIYWQNWHDSVGKELSDEQLVELSRRAHDHMLIALGHVALCIAQDAHLRHYMFLPAIYPRIPES